MLGLRSMFVTALVGIVGTGGAVATWTLKHKVVPGERPNDVYALKRMQMPITLAGTGTIESVRNSDLVCPVEGENTIRTIVPEGSVVKEGDVICELDTSKINKELQQAMMEARKSESEVIWARQELAIQRSKNVTSMESAQVEMRLAELALREYVEGVYPQKLSVGKKDVEIAQRAQAQKQDALLQTRALAARGFATAADIERDEQMLAESENGLFKKISELNVLTEFTYEKEVVEKQDKLAQARNKVESVKSENASVTAQKEADLATKEQNSEITKSRLQHWQQQLTAATIKAPIGGIVIYASSGGRYYNDTPIAPGSRILEQQLIARIPDITSMKAMLPVPESQVFKLEDYGSKSYRAEITVAGLPKPIKGTVKRVSVVPDADRYFWGSDLKSYPAEISFDETPPGLKPGMNAQIRISLRVLEDVLGVPAAALYTSGDASYVFVNKPTGGARPVRVKLGDSNETHIHVVEGLQGDESLWLLGPGQGRRLLDEAGIVEKRDSATQPAAQDPAQPTAAPPAKRA